MPSADPNSLSHHIRAAHSLSAPPVEHRCDLRLEAGPRPISSSDPFGLLCSCPVVCGLCSRSLGSHTRRPVSCDASRPSACRSPPEDRRSSSEPLPLPAPLPAPSPAPLASPLIDRSQEPNHASERSWFICASESSSTLNASTFRNLPARKTCPRPSRCSRGEAAPSDAEASAARPGSRCAPEVAASSAADLLPLRAPVDVRAEGMPSPPGRPRAVVEATTCATWAAAAVARVICVQHRSAAS
eukprot:6525370-Prymnesium_polylepis.1